MAPIGTHNAVRQLVANFPDIAIDILVSCCDDERIYREVTKVFVESSNRQPEPQSPRNNLNMTLGPQPPMSPDGSQHSDSPRPFQRMQRFSTPITRPYTTHSPPPTVSSVTSHSSRDGAASTEYVLFFGYQGRDVEEHLLHMRTANIEHSVIRQDVVHKRHLNGVLNRLDQCFVSVTQSTTPHLTQQVQAYSCIELDWRRPQSERMERSTFYIVPRGALSTDVLLSYHDSGESGSGMYLYCSREHHDGD
jgi:hypothetical protein